MTKPTKLSIFLAQTLHLFFKAKPLGGSSKCSDNESQNTIWTIPEYCIKLGV